MKSSKPWKSSQFSCKIVRNLANYAIYIMIIHIIISLAKEVDHIADVEIGPVGLPDVWEKWITSLLHECKHVFAKDDLDLGCTDAVIHRILLNNVPFKERSRLISPADFEDLREHLKELLEAGIIKKSHSPYASPIIIVRKKTGKIRMTVDYRKLNQRTVKDSFNLPKFDDVLTSSEALDVSARLT